MAYKIGEEAHGGIVFYVDHTGEHGLVAAETEQSSSANWEDAKEICSKLELSGFNDWRLPTKDELNLMYINLHKAGLGGFSTYYHWSSTGLDGPNAWVQYFSTGFQKNYPKIGNGYVRAARAF